MSFRKLWPVFFPLPSYQQRCGETEELLKSHRSGHGFQPVTHEERVGQLCLFSRVERRWGGELTAARKDLKESYKMTKSNSSWLCQTTQEGKNCKLLLGRLGLAIKKSFFLQESCAALEGVPREATKPNSPCTKPWCPRAESVLLQAELWARDPKTTHPTTIPAVLPHFVTQEQLMLLHLGPCLPLPLEVG